MPQSDANQRAPIIQPDPGADVAGPRGLGHGTPARRVIRSVPKETRERLMRAALRGYLIQPTERGASLVSVETGLEVSTHEDVFAALDAALKAPPGKAAQL